MAPVVIQTHTPPMAQGHELLVGVQAQGEHQTPTVARDVPRPGTRHPAPQIPTLKAAKPQHGMPPHAHQTHMLETVDEPLLGTPIRERPILMRAVVILVGQLRLGAGQLRGGMLTWEDGGEQHLEEWQFQFGVVELTVGRITLVGGCVFIFCSLTSTYWQCITIGKRTYAWCTYSRIQCVDNSGSMG